MSFLLSCLIILSLNYLSLTIYHKRHKCIQPIAASPKHDASLRRLKKQRKEPIDMVEVVPDPEGGED